MFFYHCLNPISEMGLNSFTGDYARTQEIQQADALLVRSASMSIEALDFDAVCF